VGAKQARMPSSFGRVEGHTCGSAREDPCAHMGLYFS